MILAITGALLIFGGALAFVSLIQRKAAAGRDPYDAGFAEAPDPVAGQYQQIGDTLGFGAPVIPSDHPTDCAELCCWEARLTEMHDAFDWSAREHEMRSKR